jgi:uncharacterized protein (DUF433 family)
MGPASTDDVRFVVPLYTMREAAIYLGMPPRTFAHWVRGDTATKKGRPLITTVPPQGGSRSPTIPFLGLAEGAVVAAFRRVHRLKMPYLRRVLEVLDSDLGVQNALASKRLYLHGGHVLWDHAKELGGPKILTEMVTKNYAFTNVVEGGLKLITYGPDEYARSVTLPATPEPLVEADPYRASGKPITLRGAVRVVDIVDRFRAGESPSFIAKDFGIQENDVLEVIRAFYSPFEEAA